MVRRSAALWRYAAGLLLFGILLPFAGTVALPITLYATNGCPPGYCSPTVVLLPLGPPLLGAVLGLFLARAPGEPNRVAALRGISLGVGGSLYLALLAAAALSLSDPYFALPYRAYGLLYVGTITATAVGWAVTHMRSVRDGDLAVRSAAPVLVIVVSGLVVSLVGRQLIVSGVVVAGAAAGALVSLSGVANRMRPFMGRRNMISVVAVIALLARAFFGLQTLARTGPGMDFAVASDDGDSYFMLASQLASGDLGAVLAAVAFPPGYSIFLGVLLAVSHFSLPVVIITQAVLAGAATLLLYAVVARVAGQAVAFVSALLYAVDQNLIQNQSTLTAEALLLPLVLVSVWSFFRYRETQGVRFLAMGAAALGVVFITRNLVAFPLLGAVALWLVLWRRRPARLLLRDAAILAMALVVAVLPIAVATAVREGTPRVTTQVAALSWEVEAEPGMTIGNGELLRRDIRPFTDLSGSIRRVVSDPLPVIAFYVTAVPQRLSTLLFFPDTGASDPIVIANPATYPNAFGQVIGLFRAAALIVGVAVATLWYRRYRDPDIALLITYSLLYVAVFALIFPPYHAFRYRIPIAPVRFAAEAVGIVLALRAVAAAWRYEPTAVRTSSPRSGQLSRSAEGGSAQSVR